MENTLKRDRAAFNDLIFEHFKHLEAEAKKWSESDRTLNLLLDDRNHQIRQLEAELHKVQRQNTEFKEIEESRKLRTLQVSNDRSRENKENIGPGDGDDWLKTLVKEVSPPSECLADIATMAPAVQHDAGVQTDSFGGIPSDTMHYLPSVPWDTNLVKDYRELKERYNVIEKQCTAYKGALDRLKQKHREDMSRWTKWVEYDNVRRQTNRKRKTAGNGNPFVEDGKIYDTPTPFDLRSSPPRPPAVSPMMLSLEGDLRSEVGPIEQGGGLFGKLRPPIRAQFSQTTGNLLNWGDGAKSPTITAKSDNFDCSSVSISETQENEVQLPEQLNPNLTGTKAGLLHHDEPLPPSDATTSDIGNENNEITPKVKNIIMKQEKDTQQPSHLKLEKNEILKEGGSPQKPVIIKSEPNSSQGDPGYHLFGAETLDLDDVEQVLVNKNETPRKRRKLDILGDTEDRMPTGDCMTLVPENGEDGDILAIPAVRLRYNTPLGIQTDSQLTELKPPEKVTNTSSKKSPPRKITPVSVDHHPLDKSPRCPRQASPVTTSNTTTPLRKRIRQKDSARRSARRSHHQAFVHILEDGTDGTKDVNLNLGTSTGVHKDSRLDDFLTTPVPKAPGLRAPGKEAVNVRSEPPNTRLTWTAGVRDSTPVNSNRRSPRRHAGTDPLPAGKKTAKVPSRVTSAQREPPQSTEHKTHTDIHRATTMAPKDDLRGYKINPARNQGLDYAYHETVRRRDERKCLPGCTRPCCRDLSKFVSHAGIPNKHIRRRGPRWRSSSPPSTQGLSEVGKEGRDGQPSWRDGEDDDGEVNENDCDEDERVEDKKREERIFVQNYSRHRDAFPRRRTPPMFWESDMLDTQAVIRQHLEADKMEAEKVTERKWEAGRNGKYIKRA